MKCWRCGKDMTAGDRLYSDECRACESRTGYGWSSDDLLQRIEIMEAHSQKLILENNRLMCELNRTKDAQ